jgi:hypothetical protein
MKVFLENNCFLSWVMADEILNFDSFKGIQKFKSKNQKRNAGYFVDEAKATTQEAAKMTSFFNTSHVQSSILTNNHQNQQQAANPIEALKAKINWAANELTASSSVRYNVELCDMMKAASEAILALKRLEI